MKTRLIPLLLLLVFGAAHAQLPPEAQALVLDKQIIDAIESGDHAAAAQFFERRKEVEVAVPPPLRIEMAKVYYALGDYLATHETLAEFLAAAAPDSPLYDTALNMYVELEANPEYLAQKEAALRVAPGRVFSDCDVCPEMVIVPAGSFMMGSEESDRTKPVHRVSIAYSFAVGVYEVTFAEWDACVADGGCGGYRPSDVGWGRGSRPVIYVHWGDAQAYTRWLSAKTGESYRLLSESEWEYVARAGTRTAHYWGESDSEQCRHANGTDQKLNSHYGSSDPGVSCNDGHVHTAPVGSYVGNGYGLHDVLGNVYEWTQDCWNESYQGAPNDGSAWESGDCSDRVARGGSWDGTPRQLHSAGRFGYSDYKQDYRFGFRVARTLTP